METDVDIQKESTTGDIMNRKTMKTVEGEDETVKSLKLELDIKHKENEALKETYLKKLGEMTTGYDIKIMQAEEKLAATLKELDTLILGHEKALKDKECEIEKQRQMITSYQKSCKVSRFNKICERDDVIRLKPKGKKGSHKDLSLFKCEFIGCESINVDTVKCNMCHKWVCEDCNGVSAAKLKSITEKCKSVYFLCKICDDNRHEFHDNSVGLSVEVMNNGEERMDPATGNINQIMKSFQEMFEKQITVMESKFKAVIENKLDEKMTTMSALTEDQKEQVQNEIPAKARPRSYSSALNGTEDFRLIMQEAKNQEIIEEREKVRREKNFIVHGLEEIGEQIDSIKNNDENTIAKILEVVGVERQMENCTRLGKQEQNKNRTLKVVMKTKQDKESVLQNLRKLKGTAEVFGKISVTDDFTKNEREQIRRYVKDAEAKSAEDPDNMYRVRGDPKNGLRLVPFPRVKVASS